MNLNKHVITANAIVKEMFGPTGSPSCFSYPLHLFYTMPSSSKVVWIGGHGYNLNY